ncbi:hypothetical protein BU14_0025s0032 [Porphyra umbilicalis]|uniref:Calnexin n=1 Tax=Porphyra umbilicalis TaxID=2786 RepID=A0A1X6PJX8_PORUM|nr:hypothetical protein BU14_0025s0032 [Porphyra umbilicalis]|eukprot:OSX81151.1 hypothetical protein BU14_0025s0032 [Porphyra umbilicalis]
MTRISRSRQSPPVAATTVVTAVGAVLLGALAFVGSASSAAAEAAAGDAAGAGDLDLDAMNIGEAAGVDAMDFGGEGEDDEGDAPPPGDGEASKDPDATAAVDPPSGPDATVYTALSAAGAFFLETFQGAWESTWVKSGVSKFSGPWAVGGGSSPGIPGDKALIVTRRARHYGITAPASTGDLEGKDFVLQYEVKLEDGLTCGGAYLKLPAAPFKDLSVFDSDTPYSIMFGPDKCGATDKVHFIFQSKHPKTGKMTEHHLKSPPPIAASDKKTHLYTLAVLSNGSFSVSVDGEVKRTGELADEFEPPVQPVEQIDDADDKKPDDWVDEAKIEDKTATKPDEWDETAPAQIPDTSATMPDGWLVDEPAKIADPAATKPDGWDDEEDGEWEPAMIDNPKCKEIGCGVWTPPMVANPAYKGPWTAPMIDNPEYRGVWAPRKIPNPDYYEVSAVRMLPIDAVGVEIWSMDQGILFDNVLLGNDVAGASAFADATWKVKKASEDEVAAAAAKKAKEEAKATEAVKDPAPGLAAKVLAMLTTAEHALEPLEKMVQGTGLEPVLDKLIDAGVQTPMLLCAAAPLGVVLLLLTCMGGRRKRPAPVVSAPPAVPVVPVAPVVAEDGAEPAVESLDGKATKEGESVAAVGVRKRRVAKAE